jgi:hypothetical protein
MTEYAWTVKNVEARIPILELVMRLERVRFETALKKGRQDPDAQARKFVVWVRKSVET